MADTQIAHITLRSPKGPPEWVVALLPALTGSERQIQWAERIRLEKCREITRYLDQGAHILLATDKPFAMIAADKIAAARKRGIIKGGDALNSYAGADMRAMSLDEAITIITLIGQARFDWVLDEAAASWWIDNRYIAVMRLGLPQTGDNLDPMAFFRSALDGDEPPPARKVRLPLATIKGEALGGGKTQRCTARVGIKDGRVYPALDGWCSPDPLRVLWDGTIIDVPGIGRFRPDRGEIDRLSIQCEDM